MSQISKSITKKDHEEKMSGEAQYIADLTYPNMLFAKIVRSTKSHAKIMKIEVPVMEEGYGIVDYKDVPGSNGLKVIKSEQPIFAEQEVCFIGESILMVVGSDFEKVKTYAKEVKIEYEDLPSVYSLDESSEFCVAYQYEHGVVEEAFKNAANTIEETFYTGYQEQAYIEPQGAIGLYKENKITVIGSMQCPYYVKNAVMYALGFESEQVQIIQSTTGGAFGGKEDYPSLIGCQVAVAAKKFNTPVKLIFERREDMAVTTKRHPAKLSYRVALDQSNKIMAMDADIRLDGGAYEGLSSVVLQRSLIAVTGVYKIPGIRVAGKVMVTNTVPNGAYRGFGAPQSFFAVEMLMTHIAKKVGIAPLELKKQYLVEQGDKTATLGEYRYPIVLPKMLERAEELSDYSNKYKEYENQSGRYRKGIGMSLFLHGCGFTGSAENDFIKSVVQLVKYKDDSIEILASNTDMGQGLKTTFSKIVAEVLEIPISQIKIVNPDTDRVPNSGPTVASRSLMIVGKLLERAATKLKNDYKTGEYQMIEEHYVHPEMIPWDINTFTGDAYPTYSWGINVVEVEVDTLLAETNLLGVWGIFDVGNAIDETIMKGQMEGGMLQGLGYGSSEKMENVNGRIAQASMTDYIIPTSKDTIPFVTALVNSPYEGGPFGAKGAGELTIIGSAPAYAAAVEEAVGSAIHFIPVTPEKLMELI
ncbi:MAG: xanthine dehydrogenase family protein molybdopterin-binding subunit [Lachnotalea sp.]